MTKKITLLFYYFVFFILKSLNFIFRKNFTYVFKDIVQENSYEHIYIQNKKINFFIPNSMTKYRLKNFFNKEKETLNWIDNFKKNSIFFDIGANNGNYSIYASCVHPKIKKIYAFEPSVLNLRVLSRNISINKLENRIKIVQLPLFDKSPRILNMSETTFEEGAAFNSFAKNYKSLGIYKSLSVSNNYSILGSSLDFLIQSKIIPIPDYIKIDVDGIEHLILSGSKKMLRSTKVKSILVELIPEHKNQYDKSFKLLKNSGFKLSEKHDFNHIFVK